MRRLATATCILAAIAAPSGARAQEVRFTGPLKGCPAILIHESIPIDVEAAYWTSAGWSASGGRDVAALAIGTEWSARMLTWRGFPSGSYGGRNGRGELRSGLWGSGGTRVYGGFVEGGAVFDVSALYHASFGTFTVRGGAGYGAFPVDRAPHATVTFAYGVRSVLARYGSRGACDPPAAGKSLAEASIARLFLTVRRGVGFDAWETVLGVELSPTFFLYPLTWWRVAGGPPR